MTTSHTNQQKSNQFANRTTKSATSSYLISAPFLSQSESIHSPKRIFINLLSYTLSQSVKPSYSSLFSFFQHPLSLSSSYFSTSSRIPIFAIPGIRPILLGRFRFCDDVIVLPVCLSLQWIMQGRINLIPCSHMCQGEMGVKDQIYLIKVILVDSLMMYQRLGHG